MSFDMQWKTVRTTMIGIGVIGALLGTVTRGLAQYPWSSSELTVRPTTMATVTRNPTAGAYPMLDSVPTNVDGQQILQPNAIVVVPPQCVGERRCPLWVQLPGGGQSARHMADWLRPAADTYGVLLLTLTTYDPGALDAALQATLQRFAVDPAKIAIGGRCASGNAALAYGVDNRGMFSRILAISGSRMRTDIASRLGPPPAKTPAPEFYIDTGVWEAAGDKFEAVRHLQEAGYRATYMLGLRGHGDQAEDYDFVGRWLAESWAKPDPATRTPPVVVTRALPELTTEAVERMTEFWGHFLHGPDSVWATARQAYLREVVVPIGAARPVTVMTDMAALAARYPAVAAAFKQAGLTPQQHDQYRLALVGARIAQNVEEAQGSGVLPLDSIQQKNLRFLEANSDALDALELAGVDNAAPRLPGLEPVWTDEPHAPLGFWRTP